MTAVAPAEVLRHRGPALLLGAVERVDGAAIACLSNSAGPWEWPKMLEGAAQAAGLLAGLQPGGPSNRAVIAEYRGVVIHAGAHTGPLRFVARIERRLLHFWRCQIEAQAADGRILLAGGVTVAPEPKA